MSAAGQYFSEKPVLLTERQPGSRLGSKGFCTYDQIAVVPGRKRFGLFWGLCIAAGSNISFILSDNKVPTDAGNGVNITMDAQDYCGMDLFTDFTFEDITKAPPLKKKVSP